MSQNKTTNADLPELETLADLVQAQIDEARRLGASEVAAAASFSTGLSVSVRKGEVDTLEHERDRSMSVSVYFGKRKGSASTSDWRPAAIEATVKAACDIARYTAEDDCAGLADHSLQATDVPDLDLHHPWDIEAAQAITLAQECEEAAFAEDERVTNSKGASVGSHQGIVFYGDSNGFMGGYPTSRHSVSCSVIAGKGETMQSDHWYTIARDASNLNAADEVGRKAAQGAVKMLGAQRLDTGEMPVLFMPDVARGLIGHFVGAISGGSLYRKSSFLLDQLGKKIFPASIFIREEPHLPGALGSAPFDGEGVATNSNDLVRDGVLKRYVLGSYSARRLGMQSTGNAGGVHNLIVSSGEKGFDELVEQMGDGLIVTRLMGQGINLLTGDYSRGASGLRVQGGKITHAVEEITIASNLRDMFSGIVEIGNDVDLRGGIRTGSILVDKMTIAGS